MVRPIIDKIIESRLLLKNPYAYLNDEGEFDAIELHAASSIEMQISRSREILQDPYAHLNSEGFFDGEVRKSNDAPTMPIKISAETLNRLTSVRKKEKKSFSEIEQIANGLQKEIWSKREQFYFNDAESNPVELLKPELAITFIGYDFNMEESLGQINQNGRMMEVAGLIDSDKKQINISHQFPVNIRNFTAAHELGHALLHEARGLHRDRPLDGSQVSGIRDNIEIEADKFASYYLMPEKLIRKTFSRYFYTDQFTLNEDTQFALGAELTNGLKRGQTSLRDLSKILAKLESYNGQHFISLARQFGVSTEAMAIRLEELKLLSI